VPSGDHVSEAGFNTAIIECAPFFVAVNETEHMCFPSWVALAAKSFWLAEIKALTDKRKADKKTVLKTTSALVGPDRDVPEPSKPLPAFLVRQHVPAPGAAGPEAQAQDEAAHQLDQD
jgi:hypothetical protein